MCEAIAECCKVCLMNVFMPFPIAAWIARYSRPSCSVISVILLIFPSSFDCVGRWVFPRTCVPLHFYIILNIVKLLCHAVEVFCNYHHSWTFLLWSALWFILIANFKRLLPCCRTGIGFVGVYAIDDCDRRGGGHGHATPSIFAILPPVGPVPSPPHIDLWAPKRAAWRRSTCISLAQTSELECCLRKTRLWIFLSYK